ncbi:MAG TPA: hypothetical protein DEA08_39175 [Planctomycetes bacterium]|nr:hypothetical protein [Planctomycetota bacterium]
MKNLRHRGDEPTLRDVWVAHALKKSAAKAVSERWSKSTATNYHYALRRLGSLAERPVALITDDEIHEARDSLLESYSANTARVSFNCLRKTWKWGHERKRIPRPWPGIASIPGASTEKRAMRDGELRLVLDWLEAYEGGRWYPYFAFLAFTGARAGEVLGCAGRISTASSAR